MASSGTRNASSGSNDRTETCMSIAGGGAGGDGEVVQHGLLDGAQLTGRA
ncbi:hypothetical protein [Streptomyces sp. NBC_00316]|nr:hypothetical protein [Streptomyces sp. NBC_00316]